MIVRPTVDVVGVDCVALGTERTTTPAVGVSARAVPVSRSPPAVVWPAPELVIGEAVVVVETPAAIARRAPVVDVPVAPVTGTLAVVVVSGAAGAAVPAPCPVVAWLVTTVVEPAVRGVVVPPLTVPSVALVCAVASSVALVATVDMIEGVTDRAAVTLVAVRLVDVAWLTAVVSVSAVRGLLVVAVSVDVTVSELSDWTGCVGAGVTLARLVVSVPAVADVAVPRVVSVFARLVTVVLLVAWTLVLDA